jgi:hypothetical protein
MRVLATCVLLISVCLTSTRGKEVRSQANIYGFVCGSLCVNDSTCAQNCTKQAYPIQQCFYAYGDNTTGITYLVLMEDQPTATLQVWFCGGLSTCQACQMFASPCLQTCLVRNLGSQCLPGPPQRLITSQDGGSVPLVPFDEATISAGTCYNNGNLVSRWALTYYIFSSWPVPGYATGPNTWSCTPPLVSPVPAKPSAASQVGSGATTLAVAAASATLLATPSSSLGQRQSVVMAALGVVLLVLAP